MFIIVASVSFAADLVRVLACETPAPPVEILVPAGRDPHSYTLLPADRARIARAGLFLYVHRTFESWLPLGSHGKEKTWFELADGLTLRPLDHEGEGTGSAKGHSHEKAGSKGHAHTSGHGHADEGVDPHIWHSPALTVAAADRLAKRLGEVFPQRSSEFKSCYAKFKGEVDAEVGRLKTLASSLPAARRVLATNHDAFGYFGEAFGFTVLPVQGISTETSPTPARLKRVIDGVRARGVRAVFLEASVAPRTMEKVAKEAGVKIGGSLFADGLGGPGSGAETVLALWRKNVETVVSALK